MRCKACRWEDGFCDACASVQDSKDRWEAAHMACATRDECGDCASCKARSFFQGEGIELEER
jgi:hypothetical protein